MHFIEKNNNCTQLNYNRGISICWSLCKCHVQTQSWWFFNFI